MAKKLTTSPSPAINSTPGGEEAQEITKRLYAGSQTLDHDVYKLEVSQMLRNLSWSEVPHYEPVEHVHFFHTCDSDGKTLTLSTSVGGHFHKMEVVPNGEGAPTVRCISGPMHHVRKKIRGIWKVVEEAVSGEDEHVHAVTYLKSDKIQKRVASAAAATYIAQEAQKTAPIPGVAG